MFGWKSGPSDEERMEQIRMDSILMADSLAMIEAEQARLVDSIAAANYEYDTTPAN
jgi:hypothetical protein